MSRALRQSYLVDGRVLEAELHLSDGRVCGQVTEGEEVRDVEVAARRLRGGRIRLETSSDPSADWVRATVLRDGDKVWVCIAGRTYELTIEEPGTGSAHQAAEEDFALSPMTGTLAKVSVAVGDAVPAGAELFVVEAMKMEYVVKAPRAVKISEVRHGEGESVDQGRVVVAFETEGA